MNTFFVIQDNLFNFKKEFHSKNYHKIKIINAVKYLKRNINSLKFD